MPDVILVRPSDSEGYVRLLLADPVGGTQAPERVEIDLGGGKGATIDLAGQRELDVPAGARRVVFPDGTDWKPS